jgi:hypothetical protein
MSSRFEQQQAEHKTERLLPLGELPLELKEIEATSLCRIFTTVGGELRSDPKKARGYGRFDDPQRPPRFAVTYFGADLMTGLAEARAIREPSEGGRLIVRPDFHDRGQVASYTAERPLRILPLTEDNLFKLNAADTLREIDYFKCQQLAAAIYSAFPDVDGLEYVSRKFPPHLCWAIFDRGIAAVNLRPSAITLLKEFTEYDDIIRAKRLIVLPQN